MLPPPFSLRCLAHTAYIYKVHNYRWRYFIFWQCIFHISSLQARNCHIAATCCMLHATFQFYLLTEPAAAVACWHSRKQLLTWLFSCLLATLFPVTAAVALLEFLCVCWVFASKFSLWNLRFFNGFLTNSWVVCAHKLRHILLNKGIPSK